MSLSFVLATAAPAASVANPVSMHLWTFILQTINVLVVMGGLYLLLFRPIGNLMASREEAVESSLHHAAQARAEADRMLGEYQEQIRGAHREAKAVIEEAARQAEALVEKRRKEAEAEYQQVLAKAEREIDAERQRAATAMRDEMAALAVKAAGQVLEREIKAEDHLQLVNEFVMKVGETH